MNLWGDEKTSMELQRNWEINLLRAIFNNVFVGYKTLHEERKKTVSTCMGLQHSYVPKFNRARGMSVKLLVCGSCRLYVNFISSRIWSEVSQPKVPLRGSAPRFRYHNSCNLSSCQVMSYLSSCHVLSCREFHRSIISVNGTSPVTVPL